MKNPENNLPPVSLFHRSASDGLWMGLSMCLTLILNAAGLFFVPAAVISPLAALWVVILGGIYEHRAFVASDYSLGFVQMWAQGICTYFFGSLFAALLTFIGLQWLMPELPDIIISRSAEAYAASDNETLSNMGQMMTRMQENGLAPTAADYARMIIMMSIIGGMVVSFFATVVARGRYNKL